MSTIKAIEEALGSDAPALLDYRSTGIKKETLHLPGPDFVDRVWAPSDRPIPVLRKPAADLRPRPAGRHRLRLDPAGRPGHRHSGGASFAKNPVCFDPEGIVKLAVEGGCNAVASTLACWAPWHAATPQDPLHRQAQPQRVPDLPEQVRPDHVRARRAGGRHGRGSGGRHDLLRLARVGRQIVEVSEAFQAAHEMACDGAVVLPAQSRLQTKEKDYHVSADLSGRPTTWA